MKKIGEIVNSITDQLSELEIIYNEATQKQSQLDKLIVEIEHEIEFGNLDAVASAKKFKEFKGVLRLRRIYKNELRILLAVRVGYNQKIGKNALDSYVNEKEKQDNAHFKDRISKQIRKELLIEVNSMTDKQED